MRERASAVVTALVILGVAAGASHLLRASATDGYLATQAYEDVYYVPPPEWLGVLSLGHDEALADLLWTRALVYFGDELRHRGDVEHALDYAEAILRLDPRFRAAYRWAGMAGMYHAGTVTVDDIRASVSFLERGAQAFPDDAEMAWDLGASLAYELAPRVDDAEEKERLKVRGVEHMQTAARLGGGPSWLALSNATQLRHLGRTEQALRHLEEMYAVVQDPEVRAQIGHQMAELRDEAHAAAFRHAHEELEARRRRDLPWVRPELYLLLDAPGPDALEAALAGDWLGDRDDLAEARRGE